MPPGPLLIGKPLDIGATFCGCPMGMPEAPRGMGLGTGTSPDPRVTNPAGQIGITGRLVGDRYRPSGCRALRLRCGPGILARR
ncbi:MAG: hypothetical protein U0792_11320 [Gemmataceae bacterium]